MGLLAIWSKKGHLTLLDTFSTYHRIDEQKVEIIETHINEEELSNYVQSSFEIELQYTVNVANSKHAMQEQGYKHFR